jgi:protein SCO1/2
MRPLLLPSLATALLLAGAVSLYAQPDAPGLRPAPGPPANQTPPALQQVRFDQRLDAKLPLDARFRDESGRDVALGEFFGKKPVVLAFVYYECPMLCTQILNGLVSGLGVLEQTAGKEFDVVAISFDARETPVMAAAKKADAAGFQFSWDEATQQFAHASGVIVVTPDGRLGRYLFGIEYPPRDLKFALMESSEGRIGSVVDQVLLYCYHYEPATGTYSLVAMNAVRLGGALTVALLLGFVGMSLRRDGRAAAGH